MPLTDLFSLKDRIAPMGDLVTSTGFSRVRARWTTPDHAEENAPPLRIIHQRVLELHEPAEIRRIGLRPWYGTHKCASHEGMLDWARDVRVHVWTGRKWHLLLELHDLPRPGRKSFQWFDLPAIRATTVVIEIRRCGIDDWWTSWTFVEGCLALLGDRSPDPAPAGETLLEVRDQRVNPISKGVHFLPGQDWQFGFMLSRPGMSVLQPPAPTGTKRNKEQPNLLFLSPGQFAQGPMLHPLGRSPLASDTLRFFAAGQTICGNDAVTYALQWPTIGETWHLHWRREGESLVLEVEENRRQATTCWEAEPWLMTFDARVAPIHFLGHSDRRGRTGVLENEFLLQAPGYGTIKIQSEGETARARTESIRAAQQIRLSWQAATTDGPLGEYHRRAGKFRWQVRFTPLVMGSKWPRRTPKAIKNCVTENLLNGISFRPDIGSLANNGASMVCPISMDTWADVSSSSRGLLHDDWRRKPVQQSLERWLLGGPGYTSGRLLVKGGFRRAEDEYLQTDPSCILGLALWLKEETEPESWWQSFRPLIMEKLAGLKERDLDGDGLIESPYRTGVSGSGHWSTCWFDVISFGWKDAFTNAILYGGLSRLAPLLRHLREPALAEELESWCLQIKSAYLPTFFSHQSQWLAGWRCRRGKLHDHAFLFVNGAAVSHGVVSVSQGRPFLEALLEEWDKVGLSSAEFGLPANLWRIPDEDLAPIMRGYPLGYYQNGGHTHSQSCHFLNGLYAAGLIQEADRLLEQLCQGLRLGVCYGGNKTGLDWHFRDGRSSGYEGLLTDQFGIIATAIRRYRPRVK